MIELDRERALKLRRDYGKVSDLEFAKAIVPVNNVPSRFQMPFMNPAYCHSIKFHLDVVF